MFSGNHKPSNAMDDSAKRKHIRFEGDLFKENAAPQRKTKKNVYTAENIGGSLSFIGAYSA